MPSTLNKRRAHKPLFEGKFYFEGWKNMQKGEKRKEGERFVIGHSYNSEEETYTLELTREDAVNLVKDLTVALARYNYNGEEIAET